MADKKASLNLLEIKDKASRQDFKDLWELGASLKSLPCHNCQFFASHIKIPAFRKKLKLEFEENEKAREETERVLGVERFGRMIEVLKRLEFIDRNGLPITKLKIARLVSSGPEILLMTELITSNILSLLRPKEIPVILSLLCFTSRAAEVAEFSKQIFESFAFSENLENAVIETYELYLKIRLTEEELGIEAEEKMTFDMIGCVDQWCNGAEFRALYQFTERMEGSIVRTMFKIDRFIESLKVFAKEFNQRELFDKLEEALKLLRRDILNSQSLYLS